MTLLAPFFLGLLLLAPAIMALHIRQRRHLVVPAIMIWQRVQSGGDKARSSLRLPPLSLSLVLQLLALLAIVIALAQPLVGPNGDVRHWIYVVENSGPADTAEAGRRPLDASLAEIGAHISGETGARYSLITAGMTARPEFARQWQEDIPFDAVAARIEPEEGNPDWHGAFALAEQLRETGEKTHIVVVARSAPEGLPGGGDGLGVTVRTVGGAALGRFDADLVADDTDGWTLSGTVSVPASVSASFETSTGTRELGRLDADGGFAARVPAQTGAGVLHITAEGIGTRSFIVHERPGYDIFYLGAANAQMALALSAVPGVQLTAGAQMPDNASQYALVVVDGPYQGPLPATNVLTLADTLGVNSDGIVRPTSWRDDHALSAGIGWNGIEISRLQPGKTGGVALVELGKVALLDVISGAGGFSAQLAFRPEDTNWASQPGIAIFASNLVHALGPQRASRLEAPCIVGVFCVVEPRLAGRHVQFDGASYPVVSDGGLAGFVPKRAGIHAVATENGLRHIAVHPMSLPLAAPVASEGEMPARPVPLWPYFAAAAVALLLAEGALALFRRRDAATERMPISALVLRVLSIAAVVCAIAGVPMFVYRTSVDTIAVGGPDVADLGGARETLRPVASVDGLVGTPDAALQLASALLPAGSGGQIVVDAGLGRPDPALVADLAARGRLVDLWAGTGQPRRDIAVRLSAGGPAYAGDRTALGVTIAAQAAVTAKVELFANGQRLWEDEVQLMAGRNSFEVPVDVGPGANEYALEVTQATDPLPENNRAVVLVEGREPRPIAVLADLSDRGAAFSEMLAGQGLPSIAVSPARAPESPALWAEYGGVVLLNMPASALSLESQSALEVAVGKHGQGLLIVGGPNSFGPGGYLDTPLDTLSPISARIPRDRPGVAIAFVLDRSSSMLEPVGNLTRLDIVKQATLAAIKKLEEESEVAVIGFDSQARVVVPLTSVNEAEFIERMVLQMNSGGGTALFRGLSAAQSQLEYSHSSARHIVVMTDGQSQPADYELISRSLQKAGITVSSVSIGEEADSELVKMLATQGGGVFHAASDIMSLPAILSEEAQMLGLDPLETAPGAPYWIDRSAEFLVGMPADFPAIDGLVLATPKPDATLHVATTDSVGESVPVLSSWQYGNGHVLALTTDAFGPWTTGWQKTNAYPTLFVQAARSFMAERENAPRLGLTRDGDEIVVSVERVGERPTLRVVTPEGQDELLAVHPAGRSWQARYLPQGKGAYTFEVDHEGGALRASIAVDYPSRLFPAAPALAASPARMITDWAGYSPPVTHAGAAIPFTFGWLGIGLLLFGCDLALRYLGLPAFVGARRRSFSRETE